jgi:hypothetical protein
MTAARDISIYSRRYNHLRNQYMCKFSSWTAAVSSTMISVHVLTIHLRGGWCLWGEVDGEDDDSSQEDNKVSPRRYLILEPVHVKFLERLLFLRQWYRCITLTIPSYNSVLYGKKRQVHVQVLPPTKDFLDHLRSKEPKLSTFSILDMSCSKTVRKLPTTIPQRDSRRLDNLQIQSRRKGRGRLWIRHYSRGSPGFVHSTNCHRSGIATDRTKQCNRPQMEWATKGDCKQRVLKQPCGACNLTMKLG